MNVHVRFNSFQPWATTLFRSSFFDRLKALNRRYISLTKSSDIEQYLDIKGSPSPLESPDFEFHTQFFNNEEQSILLRSSLHVLDSNDSPRAKRRRAKQSYPMNISHAGEFFLDDQFYSFEQGHYDGVIRIYREMHLQKWPPNDERLLQPLLNRLHGLLPSCETQTHLLHLGTDGEIGPHIDNIDASGPWLLAVSLGATRILRMENCMDPRNTFEVLLPSGSVYILRSSMRYDYKHSILKKNIFRGEVHPVGQRLSIMIRRLESGQSSIPAS